MVCGQNYHGGDVQNGCGERFHNTLSSIIHELSVNCLNLSVQIQVVPSAAVRSRYWGKESG
jgi:hypothetical protein